MIAIYHYCQVYRTLEIMVMCKPCRYVWIIIPSYHTHCVHLFIAELTTADMLKVDASHCRQQDVCTYRIYVDIYIYFTTLIFERRRRQAKNCEFEKSGRAKFWRCQNWVSLHICSCIYKGRPHANFGGMNSTRGEIIINREHKDCGVTSQASNALWYTVDT